jgi:hypothetical protein
MLAIVKEVNKELYAVGKIQDDSAIEQAMELAKALLLHNRKTIRTTRVYLVNGKGKPLLVGRISLNWRGKLIVQ